jgi:putative two-component system response regulator
VRILVVEDDGISAEMLENALAAFGHQVALARNGREALEMIRTGLYRLVISDWEMPEMTGIELCREIRRRQFSGYVYTILLTARAGTRSIVEGLDAGADDFLTKPFQPEELRVRIRTGERILALESREVTIFALAKLAESRDPETGAHLERIRDYCRCLAWDLSRKARFRHEVDGDYVQLIYMTSPLHDIGKVGIRDGILRKPGPLTPEEFEIMKQHTLIGSETLEAAASAHPGAKYLRMARDIARSHHEHFDGSGYPDGLEGEAIPLCARIVTLADVYDALTSKRVYKPAFEHANARQIIQENRGKHFDPDIVDAFLDNEIRFTSIREQFNSDARDKGDGLTMPEGPGTDPQSVSGSAAIGPVRHFASGEPRQYRTVNPASSASAETLLVTEVPGMGPTPGSCTGPLA